MADYDGNIDKILEYAAQEEQNNHILQAVDILKNAISETKDSVEKQLLLNELANVYARKEEDYNALQCFMQSYQILKQQEVLDSVMQKYYKPAIKKREETFLKNTKLLKGYQYFGGNLPSFHELEIRPVWKDQNQIICYEKDDFKQYIFMPLMKKEDIKRKTFIVCNDINIENIMYYEKNSNDLEIKEPLYLYYEPNLFYLAAQIFDFNKIVEHNRVVILVGREQLEAYFNDYQAMQPKFMIGNVEESCKTIVIDCFKKKYDYIVSVCIPETLEYYAENSSKIIKNIKSGKPKILFLTSRFTTVLQYHTRDMKEAAEKMGITTELVIEKSDLHRTSFDLYKQIYEFKPDILFCIDHFRFEQNYIPKELFWICWVQDPMPHIMDFATPGKLLNTDYVLTHYTTWKEFTALGYPKDRLLDAPIPANDTIYKKYTLTQEEKENYSCDICLVCHAGNFKGFVETLLHAIPEEKIKEVIEKVCMEYYEMAYKKSEFLYSKEQIQTYLVRYFYQEGIVLNIEKINPFIKQFYYWINQRMFRAILVRWLIEAGYTNIKLWGNGWVEDPEFRPYAMGVAENGEMLSKIYQASKIVIGNNIVTTAAGRAWESMLSGAFYMANYIPEENDAADIRKILKKEDFVMFHDREDLIQKVQFYLKHDSEREQMAEFGRQKALECMTFSNLMKRMINKLQTDLQDMDINY